MKYRFYPDTEDFPKDSEYTPKIGNVGREICKLAKKDRALYMLVKSFLEKVSEVQSLDEFLKSGEIYNFPGKDKELYEMRIPPTRKGGVFRIYFCYSKEPNEKDTLILLAAELKHEKEPQKLNTARTNLKNYKK